MNQHEIQHAHLRGHHRPGPSWHWYLDRLVASLAEVPMPDWDHYYPALAPAYR